jgi:DsbC/DsbD-like thiol-disulfide interchange protein
MSELEEKQIKLARAYKQLQADNERLYQNTLDLFLANEDALARDLERPRKMIERDATRRALVWLRELKQKHGIDLTGIFEFSEASNARLNLAERDVELEVIESLENAPSISKDLFASLRTYKAGKGQMTKQEKRKISRPKNL